QGHDRGLAGIDRAAARVAREQDPALLEELADGGHPEGERRRVPRPEQDRLGLDGVEPAAAGESGGRAVSWIDLAAGERVEAAEELHGPLAPDHVDLDRLGRSGRRRAHALAMFTARGASGALSSTAQAA